MYGNWQLLAIIISFTEDGQRKRKLRKRRVKKPLNLNIEALENGSGGHIAVSAAESVVSNEFHDKETASTFAVSSRGRVRKVKKIINSDQLDFEKLALQAEKETSLVKKRRKKQLEDEEKDCISGADEAKDTKECGDDTKEEIVANNQCQKKYVLPSIESKVNKSSSNNKPLCNNYGLDVKRYILSTRDDVLGYVDYNDVMHSGTPPTSNQNDSKVVQRNSGITNSSSPIKNRNNGQRTSQVEPIVVVSALNQFQKPVFVRVFGDQALQLMKFMKPNTKFPRSNINLQLVGKTYVVCSDVEVVTRGIPGVPDSISKLLDDVPEILASPTNTSPLRPFSPLISNLIEKTNRNNSQKTSQVEPIVAVSALNQFQKRVLVRLGGDQALQIMKFMKPNTKFPVPNIKLQQAGKTYVVCSDVEVLTRGIPGVPDSISKLFDDVLETFASSTNANTSTLHPMAPSTNVPSTQTTPRPHSMHETPNRLSLPNPKPQPLKYSSNITNSVALAYRGLPNQQQLHQPVTSSAVSNVSSISNNYASLLV